MAKQGAKAVAPRLRFPGFRNDPEWINVKVSDLLTVRDERRPPSADVPLFSLTIEGGVTAKSDRYNREFLVADPDNKKYKIVKPSDIVYNPSNLRWGAINYSQVDHAVVVSPIYEVLYVTNPVKTQFNFTASALMRPEQIARFIEKGQGTLVERIAVKIEFFLDTSLFVPRTRAEQQKIADCLTSLDEVIAAQRRKVEALKAHKRGLMQRLFPREGETRPRIRFPEFRDAPEWEEVSIGGMGEVITGSTPATSRKDYYGGDRPFVSPADISDSRLVESTKTSLTEAGFAQARAIEARSVLFVCIGSTIGKVAQNVRECATNQQINAIVANSEFSGDFIYCLLDTASERIAGLAGRQAVPIINKTQFSSVKVRAPKLAEQQRIADCLTSLDTQITAESNQLAALKTHKQGLMQQLFPAPEAAA